ncbi:MFS transporter [Uliginosibacterium sediminicola]|uniref:MFS transporter n=1 Tax=Uliginosibacterium sediminicola TaxID=2024550 RepID=A0ABU9YX26_9RHOO
MSDMHTEIRRQGLPGHLAWYLLGVVLIANVLSYVDRQILTLLVAPIRADLGISDTQLSLLHGLAFTVLYSVLGIPLGRYADRHNRKRLIFWGIVIWSAMTVACGLANSYFELFAARVGVGIGEATLAPAAYSMICDAFDKSRRGTALGVYSSGIFLGIGSSIAIGGTVLASLRGAKEVVLPIIGSVHTWQAAFIYVGMPGFLMALLLLTVKEPVRDNAVPAGGPELDQTLGYFRQHRALFAMVLLGYALIALAAYGTGSWMPTVLMRLYGWTPPQAGINYGLAVTIMGTIGGVAGGYLGDRWLRMGRADSRLWLTIVAVLAWLPLAYAGMRASDAYSTLYLMGGAVAFSSWANGLGPTAIQDLVPGALRGQATAIFFFVINMIGLGIGPTVVALVNDHVYADEKALPLSILSVGIPAMLLGIALLYLARARYRAVSHNLR